MISSWSRPSVSLPRHVPRLAHRLCRWPSLSERSAAVREDSCGLTSGRLESGATVRNRIDWRKAEMLRAGPGVEYPAEHDMLSESVDIARATLQRRSRQHRAGPASAKQRTNARTARTA